MSYRAALELISTENERLKEQLVLENKLSVNPATAEGWAVLSSLQAEADVYAKKVTGCTLVVAK